MDTFFEQIIAIRKNWKTMALFTFIWLLALIICVFFILVPILGSFTLFIIFGVLFGAYKLSSLLNIEYEYIITNGTLDIDKIVNKSSRKRMLSFELSTVSRIEKYNPAVISSLNGKKVTVACNLSDEAYLVVAEKEGSGATYLVFSPDERLRGAMVKFMPKFIANSAFK